MTYKTIESNKYKRAQYAAKVLKYPLETLSKVFIKSPKSFTFSLVKFQFHDDFDQFFKITFFVSSILITRHLRFIGDIDQQLQRW